MKELMLLKEGTYVTITKRVTTLQALIVRKDTEATVDMPLSLMSASKQDVFEQAVMAAVKKVEANEKD